MKKRILTLCLCAGVILSFAGCGAANGSSKQFSLMESNTADMAAAEEYYNGAVAMGGQQSASYSVPAANGQSNDAGAGGSSDVVDTSRKLIKTVDMDVETKEFDEMLATVQNRVNELRGYIESMDMYNGSAYSYSRDVRNVNLIIRIPQGALDDFVNTVLEAGNVINRSDSVEDITLTYVDTASRRDALRTEQDRLLALLDKAETVEDIITIESRLSDVRYQLQSIESRIRTYDNQVDYSTVYIYIKEVKELTPVVEQTAFERMATGFSDSIRDIIDDIKEFIIWFVVNIPYIIIWVIVIIIIVVVVKKLIKKAKNSNRPTEVLTTNKSDVINGNGDKNGRN